VKDWINDAQNEVAGRAEWPFLESRTSGSLTVGKAAYNLSSFSMNMLKPVDFVVWDTSSNEYKKLAVMEPREAMLWYPSLSATGTEDSRAMPSKVFIYQEKFWVQPVPDGTYTFWIRYYKLLSRMAADSAVSEVPYVLLESYAKWHGCDYYKDERSKQFRETFYSLMNDYYTQLVEKNDDYLPGMAFMDGGKVMGIIGESDPWWA